MVQVSLGEDPEHGQPTAIRVVIVEDRPTDAELMVLGLREEGFEPEWRRVDRGPDLAAALDTHPDLVLSDWDLPHFSGLEAVGMVRARDPDVPLIIVSGSVGEDAAIDALRRGADDYIIKDRMARLGPAVRHALDARRLRAEERRAAEEREFQAFILANVRDSVVVSDLDGRITYWNEGATATYGWTAHEMLGHSVAEIALADPDETASELEEIGAASPITSTWPARHKDGRRILVEAHTRVMKDASGTPVGFIGVARDVTEQRRIEVERERLAAAIEQANDAVVITDTESRILFVNPAFERITGYTRAEVLGLNPRILNSGVHPASFYIAMWSALTAGQAWVAEFTNRRKDASTFLARSSIFPVHGPDGSTVSYVAVTHDVTRERELEETATKAARERALIADTLARLPTSGSAEEVADAICRQVISLPGLAAASLMQIEHNGRVMPLSFLTMDGTAHPLWRLPMDRSRHLVERASAGPWVEAWVPEPSHPYQALFTDIGGLAIAAAPMRHGVELVGLLIVSAGGPEAVEQLTGVLPALVEFADLAGATLGTSIAERTASGQLHSRIRAMIDGAHFHPVFQPVIDLETTEHVGFEALTRFASGDRPDLLFADAWSVGLGPDLEIATLTAAIAAGARLPRGRWLSVNISPRLVAESPVIAAVLGAAERPLVLEVTEHEAVKDYEALRNAILALGGDIRVAVDDAGAGTANFAHIVGLRPNFVKLDIGLVRGIDSDVGRQALMVGMHHFARASGCRLIAEGIETRAEADTVAALGAEFGQGYLYGRPAPLEHWIPGGPDVTQPADPR